MTPRCGNCDTYFDNSEGAIVKGESWCTSCLQYCWNCDLDLKDGDVESNDFGDYVDNLCGRTACIEETAHLRRRPHQNLCIIYQQNKPYGIRDETGFLFFFTRISKYGDQEERYAEEILDQFKLAEYLLDCLNERENQND